MRLLLIVEDEGSLRRSLAQFFQLRGYEVVQAGCIEEAEGLLTGGGPFEVALVDVQLPDGNGLQLLERIGAERSIAMTAHPNLAKFAEKGVLHHMEKPLDLTRTAELVAEVAAE
jgi:DNA-binding NtrC family response regulator